MSVTLIQYAKFAQATATTCSISLDGVLSGDFLILIVSTNTANADLSSVVDSAGTAETALAYTATSSGVIPDVGVYFVPAAAAGTHTFTATFAASTEVTLAAIEFDSTVLGFDLASAVTTGNSASPASASILPSASDELLFGVIDLNGAPGANAVTWDSPLVSGQQGAYDPYVAWAWIQQGTAASVAASGTAPSGYWSAAILAFKTGTPAASVSNINGSLAVTQNAPSSSAVGGFLTPSTYTYSVTARNSYGESLPSSPSSVTIPPLLVPSGVSAALSTIASSLAAGTYDYVVTATGISSGGGSGETTASANVSATTTSTDPSVTISWSAVTGAGGYRIYRGTAAGTYTVYYSVSGSTLSYTDTGAAATSGSPPTTNTAYTYTHTVTVNWSAVSGATDYRVYKGFQSGALQYFFDVGNVTTFTDIGGSIQIGAPPTVNTTAPVPEGSTAVPVTGSNFASGMTAAIVQPNATVSVPFTYSSATAGTFDITQADAEPATGPQLAYTDSTYTTGLQLTVAGGANSSFQMVYAPPAGVLFQTITTLNPHAPNRIETIPDLVAGDQIAFAGDSAGTTAPPAGTVPYSDGTFAATENFWARAYIAADAAWTPWALITVSPAQPGQGFFGGGGV